jgi:2-keto-3-deoxy-L-fuconate dehydrogenase
MNISPLPPSPFRLDNRHALVTGGASGIGEATVKELARAGAHVYIADINLPAAQALASTVGSIEATEPEDFDRLLNVNVRSVYLVTRAFMPLLLSATDDQHSGAIVNICSVAAQVGIKQRFAYCTSKGAVLAMTRQLAVEYPQSLRVNAICPGTVETPFVEGYLEKFHKDNKEETRAQLRARQPIGRLGRPEEVAAMVRYLASDEAAFITGASMAIDGGWTAA